MDDILRTIIYLAVIATFPINVFAAWKLLSLSEDNPDVSALSERAVVAAILGIASFSGFVLSVSRIFGHSIEPALSIVLNGVSAVMISVPAIYWLWKYRGGFKDGE